MPGRSKQIRNAQFPTPLPGHKLWGAHCGGNEAEAMNEELTPRIYREYCWFALLLLVMTIGFVGRPPPGDAGTRAGSDSAPAASAPPPAHHPP